jgi:hypothetical protein
MRSAIQAFSVNQNANSCASLVEIGCNVATGVNSVSLVSLAGLTVGNLYYFRVFGSASNTAQTTGTFCFCGSAGLANGALAANLTRFSATARSNDVHVNWSTSAGSTATRFELERSQDGIHFFPISSMPANSNPVNNYSYLYTDHAPSGNIVFYRLKMDKLTGQPEYSPVVPVNLLSKKAFLVQTNIVKDVLQVLASQRLTVQIVNSLGLLYLTKPLQPGLNDLGVRTLPNGVYFIKNTQGQDVNKFLIQK